MSSAPPPSTILIVDDYEEIRAAVVELLEAEAFDVREAAWGAEGLAQLARVEGPCLVLLDLELPDMDGFEFARRMRTLAREHADTLLILTGRTDGVLPEGAAGLLLKPFEIHELLAAVEAHAPRPGNRTSRDVPT